ncbi:hypothetical protein E3T54_01245 [Cryobacterium sp. Sr8]|uniref:Uncharacterized protein n=1 Tax=Cryobacterium psychrotolerans TaxID=386301 RepID=A0A1G8Y5M3_9MICO|nr:MULTISPECIES: hypothetical protein [unclassified Cryobacterium]TFD49364.1 hypothetical protein E3T33_00465 [Cryobacterium sp. TMT1-2-1]TFD81943.1 hypothetical protein E3T54_01245 [Cryobacterium sp. Sr8]TFD90867.1 hypothetical protein E3T56_00225 [Cryobacterium psychrotolerans]SDJ97937.1 hypothetical protein SAMN05216282_10222 [Cryobacterium psychrotolerans]
MDGNVFANGSDLEIVEISPTEWRVSAQGVAEQTPAAILGFIRQVGAFFEVMSLDRWRERTYFSSFTRAAETLAQGMRARMNEAVIA